METSFGHSYRRPFKKRSEIFIDILRQEQELIALKTIPTENRRLLNLMVLARTKYMIADFKKNTLTLRKEPRLKVDIISLKAKFGARTEIQANKCYGKLEISLPNYMPCSQNFRCCWITNTVA